MRSGSSPAARTWPGRCATGGQGAEVVLDLADFYHNESRLFGVDTLKRDLVASANVLDRLEAGFEAGDYRPAPVAETVPLGRARDGYHAVAAGARGRRRRPPAGGSMDLQAALLSPLVGSVVGMAYGLVDVRSPAPPIIALLGLPGLILGEQAVTAAKARWYPGARPPPGIEGSVDPKGRCSRAGWTGASPPRDSRVTR